MRLSCLCGSRLELEGEYLGAVSTAVKNGWRQGALWKCPSCATRPKLSERVHDVTTMQRGDRAVRFCDGCHEEHDFECVSVAAGARVGKAWCPTLKMNYTQFMSIDYLLT